MALDATRRTFLRSTSAAAATFLVSGTKAVGEVIRANDRVRIAVVGLNGRGSQAHVPGWLKQDNVEIAYLVDPDQDVLAKAMRKLDERVDGKNACQAVADIRHVLDDKTVDAVSIATPNHWHSLMTIWAAQAGKHVYVEKPMSHDIAEGRIAVEAQKRHGVVVQHGTQRRSNSGIAGLHEALHSGKLPRLKIAYGYACKPRDGIGHRRVTSPPDRLDWDLWKGPAVIDGYHANLAHYNWHWFWKTGNGELNNQGTHQLDVARWAIDPDQTHPVRAMAIGGRFQWDDQGETPNTMFAMAEYPNGQSIFFNVRNVKHEGYRNQVYNEYYLEDGSRIVGEGRYKIFRPGSDKPEDLRLPKGRVTPGGEWGSFIAAVRAGEPAMANGNATDAHYGCVVGHLMNDSYRLGEPGRFSAAADQFGGNHDAAEHFGKLRELMRDKAGIPADGEYYHVGPMLEFDAASERFVGNRADEANTLLKDHCNPGFEVPLASMV